ncbi:MAG: hypothetical protein AAF889_05070 [Cyanobacteria bacterium P01_D01_bin.73]
MVFPLPAIITQLILLVLGSSIQAQAYHRRGEMNRRRSIEYSFALELLMICLGWTIFIGLFGYIPGNIAIEIKRFIVQGRWSDALNIPLLIAIPVIFFLGLEVKMLAIRILDFWLSYTGELLEGEELPIPPAEQEPGTEQFNKTRVQIFVNRYQNLQESLTQEVIFLGHSGSSIACALVFVFQALAIAWLKSS